MITEKILQKAAESLAEPAIYARGDEYFRHGHVKTWQALPDDFGQLIEITGEVKGEEWYDTSVIFDNLRERFTHGECTCPYKETCKHIVALALTYVHSLSGDGPQAKNSSKSGDRKLKSFNPADYYIELNSYRGYRPILFNISNPFQAASFTKILSRSDLSKSEKKLLLILRDGDFLSYQSETPDLEELLPLIAETGFPVRKNYNIYGNKPLTIELKPKKIECEIIHEIMTPDDSTISRHDFFLELPKFYWKNIGAHDKPFFVNDDCLVREGGDSVELHRVTPLIAKLFARIEPGYGTQKNVYRARFTGEEIAQYEQIVAELGSKLNLIAAPKFKTKENPKEASSAFVVEYDALEPKIKVSPAIRYDAHVFNISDGITISKKGGGKSVERHGLLSENEGYVISVIDKTIIYQKIDVEKEVTFYNELVALADDFGFTKTLKCNKRGTKAVADYIRDTWPDLADYAKENDCELIFTKDEMAHETALFHADFSADMNADNDWLHFDVAVYCGDEKVTLKKLFAFMESKEPFWRKADGTLVEIMNPKELERLSRLLKSFHERENGSFEGKLHNTAELQYVMTSSEHYNSVRSKALDTFLKRMQKGKPIEKVKLPTSLVKTLRPYQKEGIEWLYFLRSFRFAGILADDMGLGKTIQALTVLSLEKIEGRPSLVVCPKTLLYNWKQEASKFFPDLKTMVYDGSPENRKFLQTHFQEFDLIIVSYGTVRRDHVFFSDAKTQFNYVVLDEAQFIKNHITKNAQIVKKLNAEYRLALTGTPMENSVSEIWSIYDFLMPGFLGNYEHFAKHFHRPIMDTGDKDALNHLRQKIGSFMLRRTKGEVLKELPPKIEQMSQCHLSDSQNILYQQILAKVRGDIFGVVNEKGFKQSQIHILAGLTKLRQACNHPVLLTKDENYKDYESAKLDMCLELVDEVAESGRKVLIFSQFTGMLDIVASALKERGIKHFYLSGKTNNRQTLVDKFNSDASVPVFLISLKAGGTGLNLTSADTVIVFDPWWNPSVENQAIDRAHRIGQTKTVNVYRLLTVGTIEEKIQALKQKKQKLFDALIDESGDMFKKLTWDDVKELFSETK